MLLGVPFFRQDRYGATVDQVRELKQNDTPTDGGFTALVYVVAFIVGAIVMSFEMLGSRYLNPYFGSGIYTWAALISTVLAALSLGYFLGGWLADRAPSAAVLGATVAVGSAYLLVLPFFAQPVLETVLALFADVRAGSLLSALAIMLFPVTLLGMYSPFAIRLLLRSASTSGTVSGTVYGVSTAGSIVGTLGTTFFLIPAIGSRAITLWLGGAGVAAGLALIAGRRRGAAVAALLAAAFIGFSAEAEELIDSKIRAEVLAKKDGQIAHIETEYNDIFVTKRRNELTMSFQLKGFDYTETVVNLADPDDLPLRYTRNMTAALAYPAKLERVLMLGLGGGAISTYLGRHMKDVAIDTVEIDPGVIKAAKQYFGLIETARLRYLDGDGRVFLNRNKQTYDLVLVDAYHGGYVPFHLLTKEFYELVKMRLAPGGAAAFNVHDGTKLYGATLATLRSVFGRVDLYPTGQGEVIAVVAASLTDEQTLARRADELHGRHQFRFPLPELLAKRTEKPPQAKAAVLTDDFAPVNLYDAIRETKEQKRK